MLTLLSSPQSINPYHLSLTRSLLSIKSNPNHLILLGKKNPIGLTTPPQTLPSLIISSQCDPIHSFPFSTTVGSSLMDGILVWWSKFMYHIIFIKLSQLVNLWFCSTLPIWSIAFWTLITMIRHRQIYRFLGISLSLLDSSEFHCTHQVL